MVKNVDLGFEEYMKDLTKSLDLKVQGFNGIGKGDLIVNDTNCNSKDTNNMTIKIKKLKFGPQTCST